jgi:Glycosyltransferase Family 4
VNGQTRIRVLHLVPYSIFPPDAGGKIRVIELTRSLAELNVDVTLVTPYVPGQRNAVPASETFRLHQIPYPFLAARFLKDRPMPYFYWISFHPGMSALAKPYFRNHDIYQFEHPSFVALTSLVPPRAPVIYSSQNIDYDYVRAICPEGWVREATGRRIFHIEERMLRRADHVFAVSAADRDRFGALYGSDAGKITIAPNGVNLDAPPPRDPSRLYETFPELRRFRRFALFSGGDAGHNQEAVRFIVNDLAPRTPEIGFVIHGPCGHGQPRGGGNLFFDRNMETFADYCVPGMIALNPAVSGGGSNLKLIQYINFGLPVISTPFGMRGYDDLRPHVTVRDLPEFASALSQADLPPAADRAHIKPYAWRHSAAIIAQRYRQLLEAV